MTDLRAWYRHECVLVLLTLVCYFRALECDFSFDDTSAIKQNKDLRPETSIWQLMSNDFWGQPITKEYSHKSYRPLTVLTFRLNYHLHQLRPYGYHLVNVVLHLFATLLFFRLCSRLCERTTSLVSSTLFAVHPIHTEAVASTVGRAETLCSIFFLLSVHLYGRATQRGGTTEWTTFALSCLSIALATLSKEQGLTSLAICLLYELVYNQKLMSPVRFQMLWLTLSSLVPQLCYSKGRLTLFAPSCSLSATFPRWIRVMVSRISVLTLFGLGVLSARLMVMGGELPVFTHFDNPAAYADSRTRQLTHQYLTAFNAWLLIHPSWLCCDWTMGSISLLQSFTDLRNLATLAFFLTLAGLCIQCLRSGSSTLALGLGLTILPFLPASNLFFPVGFVIAERVLYIPSFGFCILVAHGFSRLLQRFPKCRALLIPAFLVLLLSFSAKTSRRNLDWRNELQLYQSGLEVNPNNAKLYNNIGHIYEAQDNLGEALRYFLQAVEVQPDDLGAHLNVGRAYAQLNQLQLAEDYFWKAKSLLPSSKAQTRLARIAPSHLNVFINLGNLIARNRSRLLEAEQLYQQAIAMRADYVDAYINRAEILVRLNRTREAEVVYLAALRHSTHNADLHYNLGVVSIELQKPLQAITYFDRAIQIDPNHQQALLYFGILIQDLDQIDYFPVAKNRLRRLLMLGAGENEKIYFNLAMLEMHEKNYHEAEQYFRRAIQIRENFSSATFNYALLLSETKRPTQAVPYLRLLLRHHPQHMKGLILLGDILINHVRDLHAASECYHRILRLDANNIQAKHNLCVVHVELGQLDAAEECLLEAAKIAPFQEYLDRHLKIVRLRIIKLRQSRDRVH